MRMFLWIALLVLIFSVASSPPRLTAQAGGPTITGVSPNPAAEWSYISITGQNLVSADGSCDVTVNGRQAYVNGCGASEIEVVVPWGTGSGQVVVNSDGAPSNPWPVTVTGYTPASGGGGSLRPGVIHVKLQVGAAISSILAAEGEPPSAAQRLGSAQYLTDWFEVAVPVDAERQEAEAYAGHLEVEYAAPVPLPVFADVPDDEYYGIQWALPKIQAPSAWGISKGDGVKIAIIEGGFETTHPDLAAHMLPGQDCGGNPNVTGSDPAHGTAVAGIAAAVTNNGAGIAGAAWNSLILPLRYSSCPGIGIIEEPLITRAIAENAKVLNMSYYYTDPSPEVCGEMQRAWNGGLVLVAAVGNENNAISREPAKCPHVIGVSATSPDDTKASYSSYNAPGENWVDIAAPGGSAGPNLQEWLWMTVYPSTYGYSWGTSLSSPIVAGVAALLAAEGFANCEIVETILDPANVDPVSSSVNIGVGRLNAAKALQWWGGAPIATPGNYPDGALVREESDPRVYMLLGGRKYWVHSQADLFAMGYDWQDVQCVGNTFLDFVGAGPADRGLAREFNTSQVYVVYCRSAIDPGARLPVPNAAAQSLLVNNGYAGPTVYVVPPGELAAIPGTLNEKCHIKEHSDPAQYAICDPGRKWHIPNTFVLGRLSNFLGPNSLHVLWDGGLAGYPAEADISACKHTDADGYSDLHEGYMGTIHDAACSATSTPGDENVDAWPPDFNDSRSINVQDALALKPVFGQTMNDQMARYDIVFSQSINVSDVLKMKPIFMQTC